MCERFIVATSNVRIAGRWGPNRNCDRMAVIAVKPAFVVGVVVKWSRHVKGRRMQTSERR